MLKLTPAILLLSAVYLLTGCEQKATYMSKIQPDPSLPFAQGVVHAVNIGGSEHLGVDGIRYEADTWTDKSGWGTSERIKGSQDAILFQTFYEGSNEETLSYTVPLKSGEYAITFKFAEPHETAVGDRVFDVIVEGETRIQALDVRLARDGNILSNLERTITHVAVTDEELKIDFKPIKGAPLLHAIVVREQTEDPRNWELVWQDEFDYEGAPDPTKWQHDLWPARKVNDEDQTYVNNRKNSRVENGRLIIEAHKEQVNNAEYTSARLHNKGNGDILYGRVDVKARIPSGQGTWSAAWMLPSAPFKYSTTCKPDEDWQGSPTCDAWPNSGEIDIMEHVGYDMHRVHGTVHNKAYYWQNWEQRKGSIEGVDVDQDFHVYSMEWSPEYITVSFDHVPYFIYLNEKSGWKAWPFDHAYHLILNLAIGGAWGRAGGPIDDTIFPVKMEVDYVRIYQLAQ